jgi:hypothetical protein
MILWGSKGKQFFNMPCLNLREVWIIMQVRNLTSYLEA